MIPWARVGLPLLELSCADACVIGVDERGTVLRAYGSWHGGGNEVVVKTTRGSEERRRSTVCVWMPRRRPDLLAATVKREMTWDRAS